MCDIYVVVLHIYAIIVAWQLNMDLMDNKRQWMSEISHLVRSRGRFVAERLRPVILEWLAQAREPNDRGVANVSLLMTYVSRVVDGTEDATQEYAWTERIALAEAINSGEDIVLTPKQKQVQELGGQPSIDFVRGFMDEQGIVRICH